ncbi:MAG: dUTP diphosphatase [Methanothrix sp.]|jgi:dUTP pyrophosphatase|nr:dUTP diphosphatase [Methanothrix sp.]
MDEIKPKLLFEKVYEDAKIPVRLTEYSSGYDVFAYKIIKIYTHEETENITIPFSNVKHKEIKEKILDVSLEEYIMKPNDRILVDVGGRVTVGKDYEIQVRSRSGLSLKQGVVVENSPGTIDCDYRGILGVILINDSLVERKISRGDRIAQIVVQKVELLDLEVVDKLPHIDNNLRVDGGFGHTGTR